MAFADPIRLVPQRHQHRADDHEVVAEVQIGASEGGADQSALAKDAGDAAVRPEPRMESVVPPQIDMLHFVDAGRDPRDPEPPEVPELVHQKATGQPDHRVPHEMDGLEVQLAEHAVRTRQIAVGHQELRHLRAVFAEVAHLQHGEADEDRVEPVPFVPSDLFHHEDREPGHHHPMGDGPRGCPEVEPGRGDADRNGRRPSHHPPPDPLAAERPAPARGRAIVRIERGDRRFPSAVPHRRRDRQDVDHDDDGQARRRDRPVAVRLIPRQDGETHRVPDRDERRHRADPCEGKHGQPPGQGHSAQPKLTFPGVHDRIDITGCKIPGILGAGVAFKPVVLGEPPSTLLDEDSDGKLCHLRQGTAPGAGREIRLLHRPRVPAAQCPGPGDGRGRCEQSRRSVHGPR